MRKRKLGKTELEPTLIGIGGFHLVEITQADVTSLLGRYLDAGGNYIETARGYGQGSSETKIGRAVAHRRDEFILATKCNLRGKEEAAQAIDESLARLKTDHVDILFMHGVQTTGDARAVMPPDGALAAAEEARESGKVRFIGISGHGQQDAILYAIGEYDYDVMMTGMNYYDRFNYPKTETVLLPACKQKGIGTIGMKALADGYLFASASNAIRYTLSLPIATLAVGINKQEYLEQDLEIAEKFQPMSDQEREDLYKNAPELGDYVCRLCKKCKDKDGFEPYLVFLLEGLYDRQMDDRRLKTTEAYALRERLKFWFGQADRARDIYASLDAQVDWNKDYSYLNALCPYGIDIERKLKIAHSKLSRDAVIY
jgi:predicted aldo/keto reductase-like oxidoreductase